MSPNIKALQEDLEIFEANKEKVSESFFSRLYSDSPSIKKLFKDSDPLQKHLISGLKFIVEHYNMLERRKAFLKDIGTAMSKAGFHSDHLVAIRVAFLVTAEEYGQNTKEWEALFDSAKDIIVLELTQPNQQSIGTHREASPPDIAKEQLSSASPANNNEKATSKSSHSVNTKPEKGLHDMQIKLSEKMKLAIRNQVKIAFQEALQREIDQAIKEEYDSINDEQIQQIVQLKLAS